MNRVNQIKSISIPDLLNGGGDCEDNSENHMEANMDITNKYINRDKVDVLAREYLSKDNVDNFNNIIKLMDFQLEEATNLIPELMDLKQNNGNFIHIMSFSPITAIYDIKSNSVLSVSYGLSENLFKEMFPYAFSNVDIIKKTIQDRYKWQHELYINSISN